MRVLALSSSRSGGGGFLETATPLIQDFLGAKNLAIAFIPFASVEKNYAPYAAMVQQALSGISNRVHALTEDHTSGLETADVIMVGGGNTFKLLHDLYNLRLIDIIKKKVEAGTPYIGWSAGANITGLTIGTTNDMPVIQPESFKALGFLPFQINPHYLNQTPAGFHGETRDQRLEEFVKMNPKIPVVALPEGSALTLDKNQLLYSGSANGVYFKMNDGGAISRTEIFNKGDLSFLLP